MTGQTVTPPRTRPGLVLAVACVCQAMVVLDVSVVNVALPSIATDLGFRDGSLSWVVNAYTLVFGGLLLLGGRFADLVGHRVAVLAGLGLFGVASILGGVSQTSGELVAARAAQGLAGAVLAPMSLTVIMVTFPEGRRRTRAIGIWSMVAAAGSAIGVLLGGLLTEWLGWRWVLFVNVPIAVAGAAMALSSIRSTRPTTGQRLDVPGAVLVTGAVTALVFGTIRAGDHGWGSAQALVPFAGSAVLGAAFAWWELRAKDPLVRFGILRARPVWVANVVALVVGATQVASFYFASLYLQDVLGYSPIRAGAAFLPFCLGTVIGASQSGRLAARLGSRAVLAGGMTLTAIGVSLFSLMKADSTFLDGFLLPSMVASVGMGAAMVANTALATTGVAHHESGMVSGLLNSGRQIGGSIGLAALATAAAAAAARSGASSPLDALVAGYDRAFLISAVLALVAAVVGAVFAPGRHRNPQPEPAVVDRCEDEKDLV